MQTRRHNTKNAHTQTLRQRMLRTRALSFRRTVPRRLGALCPKCPAMHTQPDTLPHTHNNGSHSLAAGARRLHMHNCTSAAAAAATTRARRARCTMMRECAVRLFNCSQYLQSIIIYRYVYVCTLCSCVRFPNAIIALHNRRYYPRARVRLGRACTRDHRQRLPKQQCMCCTRVAAVHTIW